MIISDQPGNLSNGLRIYLSSKDDGSMLDRSKDIHAPEIVKHRREFCAANSIDYENVVYQEIVYGDEQSYETLQEVGFGHTTHTIPGVQADGLFTSEIGVGLFLPVADCVATIVYDPRKRFLALLHLGRHSTVTRLVSKTVAVFIERGSNPSELLVWMSPSAKRDTYKLQWFEYVDDPAWQDFFETNNDGIYIDLPGYNQQQFISAGVLAENITISPIDTTNDPNYFSHRAGDTTDRIAVLAMMR